LRKPGDYNAPEKRINIDGGSQMRRRIEVFKENVNTSFFFLDSFFSSLPLPMARGIIATYLHKTNTRRKKLFTYLRVSSRLKIKNKKEI
jgi:hypothetical protein